MNKNWRLLVVGMLVVGLAYGLFLVMRARSNLVTLNVREADLRAVIGKIEWQTWEDIYVSPDVKGKVTLNVRKVPLEEVLRIIGEQTASRSAAIYPIYSSSATLKQLKATVRAGERSGQSPWQAWQEVAAFRFAGPLGNALRGENRLVNVQFEGKDAAFAAQSLNRISVDRVVPEDNTTGLVSLKLAQTAMPDAVAQIARQVKRDWAVFYLLSPAPFMGRPATPGGNPMAAMLSQTPEQKAAADQQFEAGLATLSPEEQEKAKQRRDQMEAIRKLPPEERAQAMQQTMQQMMSDPATQSQFREQMMNRFTSGIKDSTPDQRVERSRTINERRKMFQNTPTR